MYSGNQDTIAIGSKNAARLAVRTCTHRTIWYWPKWNAYRMLRILCLFQAAGLVYTSRDQNRKL